MDPIFDLAGFFESFKVAGLPLVFIVVNFVQWAKKSSPNARTTRLISVLFGLALGILYWISVNPIVNSIGYWLTAVVFGIALGLFASKTFDAATDAVAAGNTKALQQVDEMRNS